MSKACLSLQYSWYSPKYCARHYFKLSNPVFSVMSKACLLCWLYVYLYISISISICISIYIYLYRYLYLSFYIYIWYFYWTISIQIIIIIIIKKKNHILIYYTSALFTSSNKKKSAKPVSGNIFNFPVGEYALCLMRVSGLFSRFFCSVNTTLD